jgi:hypothetical protein
VAAVPGPAQAPEAAGTPAAWPGAPDLPGCESRLAVGGPEEPFRPGAPARRLRRHHSDASGPVDQPGQHAGAPGRAGENRGRHLVPDELVQAATYRLPPDRVARAKVRDAASLSELQGEPTSRLPTVPKPRST